MRLKLEGLAYIHIDKILHNSVHVSVQPLRSKVEWMHRTVKNLQSPKSVQNFACDVLSIYDHIPLCRFVWFGLEQ